MNIKHPIINLLALLFGIALIFGISFYWKNLRGALQETPPQSIEEVINTTGMPLKVPPGFSIEIFAKNLAGARVMALDSFGNMWVSRPNDGVVTQLEINNGKVTAQHDILKNLNNPHGLAFDPKSPSILYIAEEDKISKIPTYSDAPIQKIADLPSGGGHSTRTIGFGPDNRLYVSIGSSCNVCHETDSRRAKIFSMKSDGNDFKEYAHGLRNAVFFTWSYIDGKMWATEMGRDLLGDNTPPDEINIIGKDKNYGWPNCYGKNIHDTEFDKNTYIRNPCMEPFETPSYIDLEAHSAPLGLQFVPEEGWPEEYWHNLLVAFHGSWNRTEPTGYKIVRIKLDAKGNYQGIEDFITGWLSKDGVYGRPVDLLIQPGGTLYISDDKAGVIYKVYKNSEHIQATNTCRKTGCSGQICSDTDMVSTCEYKENYACYKNAECKRQSNGVCGWTETLTLKACLNKIPELE